MKLIFAPIGVAAGILAGLAAQKGFERLWAAIDDEAPPEPERRDVPHAKLAAALVLEGAVFRLVKGLADHGARRAFERATGRWPGDE
jgi:hypothetical protein